MRVYLGRLVPSGAILGQKTFQVGTPFPLLSRINERTEFEEKQSTCDSRQSLKTN